MEVTDNFQVTPDDHFGCCGNHISAKPRPLSCNCCRRLIHINRVCYSYQSKREFIHCINQLYVMCPTCFNRAGARIILQGWLAPLTVEKSELKRLTNNIFTEQISQTCNICKKKYHVQCMENIESIVDTEFVCDSCLNVKKLKKLETKYTADSIYASELDIFMESNVNNFLKDVCSIPENRLIIRSVSCSQEVVHIDDGLARRFEKIGVKMKPLHYTSRTVLVFQKQVDRDVLLFVFFSHEFGSESPEPNRNKIYLAYLDSVNYFQPPRIRSQIYHDILLSYADYMRNVGYEELFIWSCPPAKNVEYIFYLHPSNQKIPDQTMLNNWYKALCEKGIQSGVFSFYMNFVNEVKNKNIDSIQKMPYFVGDLPVLIAKEELQKLGGKFDCEKLWKNVFKSMQDYNESYFCIYLSQPECLKSPSLVQKSRLLSNRCFFFEFCHERNIKFSTLKDAKISTLLIIKLLLLEKETDIIGKCTNCGNLNETRYVCTKCIDKLQICSSCYEKHGHEHIMKKLGLNFETIPEKNKETVKKEITRKFYECYSHVKNCSDKNCLNANCNSLKMMILHETQCKNFFEGETVCELCMHYMSLLTSHSSSCKDSDCVVPYCIQLKEELKMYLLIEEEFCRLRANMKSPDNKEKGNESEEGEEKKARVEVGCMEMETEEASD